MGCTGLLPAYSLLIKMDFQTGIINAVFGVVLGGLALVAVVSWAYQQTPAGRAPQWFGGDEFLMHLREHRIVFNGGRYGSGKSSGIVFLSYLFLRYDIAEKCISNMPVSWAVPAVHVAPYSFVVLLDELGVFFDARSFGSKQQNKFRKNVVAYLRKFNSYLFVASRVSPDASFRGLAVQRLWSFIPFIPLEIYQWSLEDGEHSPSGYFGFWNRGWTWRVDTVDPSPKYVHNFIPSSVKPIEDLFIRAVEEVVEDDEWYDPNNIEEERAREDYFKWLGLEYRRSPNSREGAWAGEVRENTSREGDTDTADSGGGQILIGVSGEVNRSGRTGFTL